MDNIIQLGLDEADDKAYIQVGGKWKSVPAWLWIEWEVENGIQSVIDTWQRGIMKRYYPPDVAKMIEMGVALPDIEDEVIKKIHIEARAMRRFMSGAYRDVLNPIEIQALTLEKQLLFESPGMGNSRDKFDWIAQRMSRRGEIYKSQQIRDILEGASQVMAARYELELAQKMVKTLKALPGVWFEARLDEKRALAA